MIHQIHGITWGPVMLIALIALGIIYSIRSGFFQIRKMGYWRRTTAESLWNAGKSRNDKGSSSDGSGNKNRANDKHPATKVQAACTVLAATVGTGNIVGVATALTVGDPGAIFWMWMSAAIDVMIAYAEISLGIRHRYRNAENRRICRPMVYLEKGLHMSWLGLLYSILCILSPLGMRSTVQFNAIAETMSYTFGAAPLAMGLVLAVLVLIAIWGGTGRTAYMSERLIPASAGTYIIFSLVVIFSCYDRTPLVMGQTLESTLVPEVLLGGVGGYGTSRSLRYGIARGTLSNEAGPDSLAILHGAAEDTTPKEQGMWVMLEVFFDTAIICTLTVLVMLCMTTEGLDNVFYDGAALTTFRFERWLGDVGRYLVSDSMLVFAFVTIIAQYYLGRRTMAYILDRLGRKSVFIKRNEKWLEKLYLLLYPDAIYLGCIGSLKTVRGLSDIWSGLMAVPSTTALVFLIREVTFPKEPGRQGRWL